MIRKTFCEGFAAGLLGLGAISVSAAAELRGIHLSTSADSAQVTLDLTEGATHKLFTLEHPDRVVIDLSQTRLASEVRPPAASGVVTEVRFGGQPDGTLRVVVQLKSALAAHSAWAPGEEGRRLVLILGEPAQAPAEAAPKRVRAPHAPGDGARDVIIAVDAGHGGVDPGAI
jgi:N-acetylmuramoyl-L-alanine amidase